MYLLCSGLWRTISGGLQAFFRRLGKYSQKAGFHLPGIIYTHIRETTPMVLDTPRWRNCRFFVWYIYWLRDGSLLSLIHVKRE